jgi:glutamate racemase
VGRHRVRGPGPALARCSDVAHFALPLLAEAYRHPADCPLPPVGRSARRRPAARPVAAPASCLPISADRLLRASPGADSPASYSGLMRIALINSGLGLLAAAAELHRLRPDADLVLAMDPDGMPWGPRSPDDIASRSLACARAAATYDPDALVFACNTGTVHALDALRAEFEPGIPVVGTVPAIKPAAARFGMVSIWATVATTGSAYQRQLITEFAGTAQVTPVACPGLADAIDSGDEAGTAAAIVEAAARTPADCGAVVLGCTEYELAADSIAAALPGVAMFGSAAAIASQTLRRIGADAAPDPAAADSASATPDNGAASTSCAASGSVRVLLSGRQADLPSAALCYQQGRLLAELALDRPQVSP